MSDSSGAIDRTEFGRLVREGLANLYDQAALQTSPLAALLLAETGERRARPGTRAELLRATLIAAIEQLRPAEKTSRPAASEWRSYLLLAGRYVEGESLQDLQKRLALSERQLRREHSRALEAVAAVMWDQATRDGSTALTEEKAGLEFALNLRPLNALELLQGVALTLRPRAESEDVILHLPAGPSHPRILADRIILRQILLSLLNLVFDLSEDGQVYVAIESSGPNASIAATFRLEDAALLTDDNAGRVLTNAQLWARRCGGDLLHVLNDPQPGLITLRLTLPRAEQPLVLVVDDQEIATQLYDRYLSRSGIRLIGLRTAGDAVSAAKRIQPQAIILDVVMPDMDGWEVLQLLKADASTRDIPVIMCSVWEEPELAMSLGAADFLKKPITQKNLLSALTRLRLLERAAE